MRSLAFRRSSAFVIIPAAAMPSASRCEKSWIEPSVSAVSRIAVAAADAAFVKAAIWFRSMGMFSRLWIRVCSVLCLREICFACCVSVHDNEWSLCVLGFEK